MAVLTGINGFGRIGRCVLRAWAESERDDVKIVAVNSRADISIAAHLLQYDTTHGKFDADVRVSGDDILINGHKVRYTRCTDIGGIDWPATKAQLIMECTGAFSARDDAAKHLSAGAKQVLISAPGKNADATVVYGVNHALLKNKGLEVVSAASCTTNCLAPVVQTLHEQFGIIEGWATSVHAFTADQRLLDESHSDLRRARAAGMNIIPTKTGAAESIGVIIPELKGRLGGIALRVPVNNVSLVDLTCRLSSAADVEAINSAFADAADVMPPGVMTVSDAPLVSSDYNHNIHSACVDLTQTRVVGGLTRVMAWYDNEWAFANRMLDVAAAMSDERGSARR